MIEIIKKLLFILSPSELKQTCLLIILILIVAILDMIGVASIMPFMAVLSNPEIVESNSLLKELYLISNTYGIMNIKQFLIALGITVFLILIFSLLFKAITFYIQFRFIAMREYSLGKRLIESYLNQPYIWFLNRHSADIAKTILGEAEKVANGIIRAIIDIIAAGAVSFALFALLIFANPEIAIVSFLILGVSYLLIYGIGKDYISRIGKERLKANEERFKVVNEAFSATKEIKTSNLEYFYINRFMRPAKTYAWVTSSAQIIFILPKFALEIIAFGGLLLLTLYQMKSSENFANIIPILALYALSGYRLLPALQKIYGSLSLLRFYSSSLIDVHKDLTNLNLPITSKEKEIYTIQKSIVLKKIHYTYPNNSKQALTEIDMTIPALSSVALIGATGSGKTTIIDLILGLLEAQKGTLEVDGNVIGKNNRNAWQRSIGYVPQQIYLSDDTISANIAFGISPDEINQKAVEKASKVANLHDFIETELTLKYKTIIGERGVRLSGGQRQRIGIARALYHSPQILIMDEATSALDNLTERAVMEAVNKLNHKLTIILIAHRMSTVKKCDIIFLLDKGKLIDKGDYKHLIKTNKYFKTIEST